MRISDWSSDVCSSDLALLGCLRGNGRATLVIFVGPAAAFAFDCRHDLHVEAMRFFDHALSGEIVFLRTEGEPINRSEEHTSELQSLMRISYAVFCLNKPTPPPPPPPTPPPTPTPPPPHPPPPPPPPP